MEQLACKWARDRGELVWRHRISGDRITIYRNGACWQIFYRKTGVLTTAHHAGDVIKTADNWAAISSFLAPMGIKV